MKTDTCLTCVATAECTGFRKLTCRWCEEGHPPYHPRERNPQGAFNFDPDDHNPEPLSTRFQEASHLTSLRRGVEAR